MTRIVKALELTGTVDEKYQLHLDKPLPFRGPSRVRVLILVTEKQEINEDEWLRAAAANAAFDVLQNPVENMYTLTHKVLNRWQWSRASGMPVGPENL